MIKSGNLNVSKRPKKLGFLNRLKMIKSTNLLFIDEKHTCKHLILNGL